MHMRWIMFKSIGSDRLEFRDYKYTYIAVVTTSF